MPNRERLAAAISSRLLTMPDRRAESRTGNASYGGRVAEQSRAVRTGSGYRVAVDVVALEVGPTDVDALPSLRGQAPPPRNRAPPGARAAAPTAHSHWSAAVRWEHTPPTRIPAAVAVAVPGRA